MTAQASQDELSASQVKASEMLQSSQGASSTRRRNVAGLGEDDTGTPSPAPIEFVKSKDVKAAQRKWEAKKRGDTAALKMSPLMRLLVIAGSTVGMLLFGYRMYLRHYSTPNTGPRLYTKEYLARVGGPKAKQPMISIGGEVYEVSKAPEYYREGGSYSFFSGVDASRAYLTGKFQDDLNDDVADFSDEQFAGLVHWKEFYLKQYTYKGRLIGTFFDEQGNPTPMVRTMLEATQRSKIAKKEREAKRLTWPSCSSRWSQNDGTEVWCAEDMHPRLLTEMVAGKAEHRCACFKEIGWSDLRRVYDKCKPDAHRCKLTEAQAKMK